MNNRTITSLAIMMLVTLSLFPSIMALAQPSDGGPLLDGGDSIMGTQQDYVNSSNGLPKRGNFNGIVMGDVNGDGYDDIAAAAGKGDSTTTHQTYGLRVFTSKSGTSWVNSSTGLPSTGRYGGIDLGDLDGDGDLDLVAGGEGHASSTVKGVTVWLNGGIVAGKLTWNAGTKPESNRYYETVVIDDINGDGKGDIIAGTRADGIKVWIGNGGAGGSLQWTAKNSGLPSSNEYTSVQVGDFNGDGNADIVATDYLPIAKPEVRIYTGDGKGSWTSRESSMPNSDRYYQAFGVDVGDFNKDGNLDMIYGVKTYGVRCYLGNGGGSDGTSFCWTEGNNGLATRGAYYGVDVGDVDKDGDHDVLVACSDPAKGLEVYLSNGGAGGSMKWTKATWTLSKEVFFGAALGDFNNDTVLDVAGAMWEYSNNGGLRAMRSTVPGANAPDAEAVWNGTTTNETTVFLGEDVTLDGRLSSDFEDAPGGDTTGTILTYEWDIVRTPAGSSITDTNLTPDDKSATASFTPDAVGNFTLSLAVKDTDGQWSEERAYMELEVVRPNDLPIAVAGPDQDVFVGAVVKLDGSGSYDPDGAVLAWQWNASPVNPSEVYLQNSTLPEASFLAPEVTGVYTFNLSVRDSNETWSLEDVVNVTVTLPPNEPPVAVVGADFAARVGEEVTLDGSASYDTDGDIVVWSWRCTSHPMLSLVGADAVRALFTPELAGNYTFELRVLDDRGDWSESDTLAVTILPGLVNIPPVAEIEGIAVRTAVVGEEVTLDGSASWDQDGQVDDFRWNCTSHPALPFTGQDSSEVVFTATEPGDYIFTLAVRDDNSTWSIDEAMVTVKVSSVPVNQLPVPIIEGPEGPVPRGTVVILDGSASFDPDGVIVTFTWESTSHSGLLLSGQGTVEITFTLVVGGEYTFTLVVQDEQEAWSDEAASFTTGPWRPGAGTSRAIPSCRSSVGILPRFPSHPSREEPT
jgi:uncharacterized Zn-binding protein involved in type VI secretion